MSLISIIDTIDGVLCGASPETPISKVLAAIRAPLASLREQLEAFEDEQASFQTTLEKVALQQEFDTFKAESVSQMKNLQTTLDAANVTIQRLSVKPQQKAKSDAEIEDDILEALIGGNQRTVEEISKLVNISPDKCQLLLGDLYQAQCAGPTNQAHYVGFGHAPRTLWHLLKDGLRRLSDRGKI